MSTAVRSARLVSLLAALASAPALAQTAVAPTWSVAVPGYVDGYAVGDILGDSDLEIVLIERGGNLGSPTDKTAWAPAAGTIEARAANGSQAMVDPANRKNTLTLWSLKFGAELAGYPVVANFLPATAKDEIAFCDASPVGYCRVLDGAGTLLRTYGPFDHPGMSTAGPSAADLTGDGTPDLVIASWGGEVAVYDVRNNALKWSVNLKTLYGERIFGHAALGDLNNDGVPDVVVGGYQRGGLYALNGKTGASLWAAPAHPVFQYEQPGANYLFASGPTLADVNGDARPDVLVAMAGTDPAVLAYSSTGTQLWRRSLPGARFGYVSPVVTPVNTANLRKIVVQSGEGTLYVLNYDGTVRDAGVKVGTSSWVAPCLLDVSSDGVPEIAALSENQVQARSGAPGLAVLGTYTHPNGGLMPAPISADLNRDTNVDAIVASWWDKRLMSFGLGVRASARGWTSLGGGPTRAGTW